MGAAAPDAFRRLAGAGAGLREDALGTALGGWGRRANGARGVAAGSRGRLAARLPDRARSLDVSAGYPARAMAEAQRFWGAGETDRRRSGQALPGSHRALEPRARGRGRVRLRGDPR